MWTSATVAGDTYHLYKQEHGESCGPSSVLMMMRLRDGTLTAEAMVRLWFSLAEKTDQKAGKAVYGEQAGKDARIFDFAGGAGLDTIVQVLNGKRPKYRAKRGGRIKDITAAAPGILRVQWPGAGGHFIVCIGKFEGAKRAGFRVFLDPWYGLVVNRHDIYPNYDTSSGSFGEGAATGRITHVVTTS